LTSANFHVLVLFMPNVSSADARTQRHLETLQELAELGMRMARAVTEQAVQQAEAGEPVVGDPGLVLSRIARSVRQTIALEAKLAEDHRAGAAKRIAGETQVRAARGKRQVKALVERAIEADAEQTDTENLFFDLVERLEVDYEDADFADRPVAELASASAATSASPPTPASGKTAGRSRKPTSPHAKRKGEGRERAAQVSPSPPRIQPQSSPRWASPDRPDNPQTEPLA
jgi:hypothetical protein